jgi:5-methylcytosine-specific restriction enzyme A
MPGNPFYLTPFWKALRREALDRDGWRCVVPGCSYRSTKGLRVDHIQTRPNTPAQAPEDVLSNLRTLCPRHDSQIKELSGGARRSRGLVPGCDPSGRPLDPAHHWNAGRRPA